MNNINYLRQLFKLLEQSFNLDEVRMLCFNLGIDHEMFPIGGKPSVIRELLFFLGRNDRIEELITLTKKLRPNVKWPSVPFDFEPPSHFISNSNETPNSKQNIILGNVFYGDQIGNDKVEGNKIIIGNLHDSSKINDEIVESNSYLLDSNNKKLLEHFEPVITVTTAQKPSTLPKIISLQKEAENGEHADDKKMAELISEIVKEFPAVRSVLINIFTKTELAKITGEVTRYALKQLNE